MFYNALARKGKLDPETKEEDMTSVVAIHNCMNKGTWKRILAWDKVLSGGGEDGEDGDGLSLTKFLGRPTDLSPKAFIKHYLFGHPLPFDRHDWTVTRRRAGPGGSKKPRDMRYVIDYYHNNVAASADEGSGVPDLDVDVGPNGGLHSLLVDVRPDVDGMSEVWGRAVLMPLARRGCRSILECVLYGGRGFKPRSNFKPLPLKPSDSLKASLGESKLVWENIKRDAAMKKGVGAKDGGGEACASDSLSLSAAAEVGLASAEDRQGGIGSTGKEVNVANQEEVGQTMGREKATNFAGTYSRILSRCESYKKELRTCGSEEECHKAYVGMTVCAGQFMCPLQHSAFLASLEGYGTGSNKDAAEARVDTAMEILGECVLEYDGRASVAKRQYPDLFDEVVSKGLKK
jgi:cytochrome c heme-lyase